MSPDTRLLAARFGRAADEYEHNAPVQRLAADRLAQLVAEHAPAPARVLEVGCGTGLLTRALMRRLPPAAWVVSDLAEPMLRRCLASLPEGQAATGLVMDAARSGVRGRFDLVCAGLVLQWAADLPAVLSELAGLVAEGGLLAVSLLCAGSFESWRSALAAEGGADRIQPLPDLAALEAAWPTTALGAGEWRIETVVERHARAIDLPRGLRAIGADLPRSGSTPTDASALRRALRRLDHAPGGALAEYRIGYGLFRTASRRGVFVTGTDTGVGKTLVAACLVRAWGATYWKPMQTGLATEPGDSETVRRLAALSPERALPPAVTLAAPLSPEAAADLEGVTLEPARITLPPEAAAPLVVEGAGGLVVPTGGGETMIDLIVRLGLPVVLVARGGLGTINHTLLSLEALRRRRIPVYGVVLNGPSPDSTREAITRLGRVRILACLPHCPHGVDEAAVARFADLMPGFGAAD